VKSAEDGDAVDEGRAGATPSGFRTTLAGLAMAMLLGACATVPPAEGERIVEVASGRAITRVQLIAAIRASDYTLLGELHDNGWHHRRRGELLAELGPGVAIVAEHMPRGQQVQPGPDLQARLVAAGFDARAWGWPMHEPLFDGALASGATLAGANAKREEARQVAREGPQALPEELRPIVTAAPLAPAAQAALDADLVSGHCGQLDGPRLEGMRSAQRLRDASMWAALRDAAKRPAILLAGNGHVRLDYGVPQVIAATQPGAKVVSVGFLEIGAPVPGQPYTHVWVTPGVAREDACAAMRPAR
jgi:uncharacterized iron-regulated protein